MNIGTGAFTSDLGSYRKPFVGACANSDACVPRTREQTRKNRVGVGIIRTVRTGSRTCSNGCDSSGRSWPGAKDAGS